MAAPDRRCEANILNRRVVGIEPVAMPFNRKAQRPCGFPGGHEQTRRAVAADASVGPRRFLHHYEGVGSPKAERIDGGKPGTLTRRPMCEFGVHEEWCRCEINLWIGRTEIEAWRDLPVVQRQCRLDQGRNAGCLFQMSDVGLDRTDCTKVALICRRAEGT